MNADFPFEDLRSPAEAADDEALAEERSVVQYLVRRLCPEDRWLLGGKTLEHRQSLLDRFCDHHPLPLRLRFERPRKLKKSLREELSVAKLLNNPQKLGDGLKELMTILEEESYPQGEAPLGLVFPLVGLSGDASGMTLLFNYPPVLKKLDGCFVFNYEQGKRGYLSTLGSLIRSLALEE